MSHDTIRIEGSRIIFMKIYNKIKTKVKIRDKNIKDIINFIGTLFMNIYNKIKTKLNISDKNIKDTTTFIQSKSKEALDTTQEKLLESYGVACDKTSEVIKDYKESRETISDVNWYKRSALACEDMSDALLREDSGTSTKITKGVVGKLGAAGTSVGIFSIASLLGTASTGTAIGSLSGAAFTSASLAWLGGSVAMGSIIIGVASIAGGIGAVLGAGWVFKKYVYGSKREKSELELKEQNIIDTCLALSIAFRNQEASGIPLDPISANALYTDALKPLTDDLLEYKIKTESWPFMARKRLEDSLEKLVNVSNYLKDISNKNPSMRIGIVSSVFIQLISEDISSWDENEILVIEALRRSKNELHNASYEELSEYVKKLDPESLQNNVKGIYHELRFARDMNENSDEYIVELFEATNHPGADVKIINTITGDVKEIQLKATEYLTYIKKHNEKYQDIEVFATSEVAELDEGITSTNISNKEITNDTSDVLETLDDYSNSTVASSMSVAAMVTLAKNAKVLLRKGKMTQKEREKMTKDGLVAAGVAGITSLLIG